MADNLANRFVPVKNFIDNNLPDESLIRASTLREVLKYMFDNMEGGGSGGSSEAIISIIKQTFGGEIVPEVIDEIGSISILEHLKKGIKPKYIELPQGLTIGSYITGVMTTNDNTLTINNNEILFVKEYYKTNTQINKYDAQRTYVVVKPTGTYGKPTSAEVLPLLQEDFALIADGLILQNSSDVVKTVEGVTPDTRGNIPLIKKTLLWAKENSEDDENEYTELPAINPITGETVFIKRGEVGKVKTVDNIGPDENGNITTKYQELKESIDNEIVERARVDNLKLDKPTSTGSTTSHPNVVGVDSQGNSAKLPANSFGKVDTIDGIEADENKNIALGAVRKSESNTVTDDFSMQQENGAYVSIASNGLKVGFGGITATYGNSSISVDNLVPDAAYKFQEILFPKRAVKNVEEKVYPVTYVNGVKADENGCVDISGVALNWTHANQRFSGLADRSSDATFNGIMGLDNSGNAAKITQSARLLEATLQGTTSEQALRIGNLLNGGNGSSGAISVNLISPPLLQNTRNDIEYVLLRGSNLLLNNTDMSISICDEGKSVIQRIPNEQIINNSTTELLFYYNFYQFTTGTYYLKITSGVKIYFTTLDLQIVDEIENIDINAITWDINYKEGVIPKNTDNASGGYVSITTLKPVTELPIQSLKSSPLFSKDDDFYIEFTLELGPKWLHVSRYFYFSFIGLGDSSIPNTLFNNSFIYLKYSHSWDDSNAMYNNDSRISNFKTQSKIIVNVIKTKGICRMVIGSSNVNVIIPNMDYFSLFMAFTGNEYELLTQIKIIKAFKIK